MTRLPPIIAALVLGMGLVGPANAQGDAGISNEDARTQFRYAVNDFLDAADEVCDRGHETDNRQQIIMLKIYYDIQMADLEGSLLAFDAEIADEDAVAFRARQRKMSVCRVLTDEEEAIASQDTLDRGRAKFDALDQAEGVAKETVVNAPPSTQKSGLWQIREIRTQLRLAIRDFHDLRQTLCPGPVVTQDVAGWNAVDREYGDLLKSLQKTVLKYDVDAAEADNQYRWDRQLAVVECSVPAESPSQEDIVSSASALAEARRMIATMQSLANTGLETLQ